MVLAKEIYNSKGGFCPCPKKIAQARQKCKTNMFDYEFQNYKEIRKRLESERNLSYANHIRRVEILDTSFVFRDSDFSAY